MFTVGLDVDSSESGGAVKFSLTTGLFAGNPYESWSSDQAVQHTAIARIIGTIQDSGQSAGNQSCNGVVLQPISDHLPKHAAPCK
jgi:Na+/serine symporter